MLDPRRRWRAARLLEMVERRGPLALQAFQDVIADHYPHLYVLISDWDETETDLGESVQPDEENPYYCKYQQVPCVIARSLIVWLG